MKTPVTYYGGKQRMVKHILPLIPEHELYCEPFCGGAAVFFAKEPSKIEVLNDLNKMVITFYSQIKNNFNELQKRIQSTLLSRASFMDAWTMYNNPHLFEDIDLAWAFWVLTQQGFCGKISKTWSFSVKNQRSERTLTNKKNAFLEDYQKRLEHVQIECTDALKVIKSRDRPTTFFYVDPPYFNSNMGHYGGYTEANFRELLETLANIKGKFILSSYPSEILTKFTQQYGWKTQEIEQSLQASRSKKKRKKVEVLTGNF